jgi:dolichol-phosphate mannosyltransferase
MKNILGVYGWNSYRKFVSRGANFFASFLLKPEVSDLTGSFRLYRKSVFDELMNVVKTSGYAFQMEIIIRAQYLNFKISEVPISFVDRLMGKSKLGFNEIILYFKTVLKLYVTI